MNRRLDAILRKNKAVLQTRRSAAITEAAQEVVIKNIKSAKLKASDIIVSDHNDIVLVSSPKLSYALRGRISKPVNQGKTKKDHVKYRLDLYQGQKENYIGGIDFQVDESQESFMPKEEKPAKSKENNSEQNDDNG